jgi:hypothetical protein
MPEGAEGEVFEELQEWDEAEDAEGEPLLDDDEGPLNMVSNQDVDILDDGYRLHSLYRTPISSRCPPKKATRRAKTRKRIKRIARESKEKNSRIRRWRRMMG